MLNSIGGQTLTPSGFNYWIYQTLFFLISVEQQP